MINSINMKDLVVEVEFDVGNKSYKVIRGAKPNKFELYLGKTLVNQDATIRDYQDHLEKNILKMSHRSYSSGNSRSLTSLPLCNFVLETEES